jgi:hypothetical protein
VHCQAVYIATSTEQHSALVLRALERGKDVLVEKPVCQNLSEARLLHEWVRSRSTTADNNCDRSGRSRSSTNSSGGDSADLGGAISDGTTSSSSISGRSSSTTTSVESQDDHSRHHSREGSGGDSGGGEVLATRSRVHPLVNRSPSQPTIYECDEETAEYMDDTTDLDLGAQDWAVENEDDSDGYGADESSAGYHSFPLLEDQPSVQDALEKEGGGATTPDGAETDDDTARRRADAVGVRVRAGGE